MQYLCIYESRYHHHHTNYVHLYKKGISSPETYNGQFSQKWVQCIDLNILTLSNNVPITHSYAILVQLMNVLVFLVNYGAIKMSKVVADIIMKLLQNGMYTYICLLLREVLMIRHRMQSM